MPFRWPQYDALRLIVALYTFMLVAFSSVFVLVVVSLSVHHRLVKRGTKEQRYGTRKALQGSDQGIRDH